jgi:K+-transporting ATPase ATPase C chain
MLKQLRPAVVSVLVMMVVFGLIFSGAVTAVANVLFPHQASGSLVVRGETIVGSELIGQNFSAPGYFHPRPSAAGNGYDPTASGGTNLGPTSDKLINGIHKKLSDGGDDPGNYDGVRDLAKSYRAENGLAPDAPIPADAVTRSASGLDPEISPANAALQVRRVAKARGLTEDAIRRLVTQNTSGRQFGVLGESRVNVLKLNLALDEAAPGKSGARS